MYPLFLGAYSLELVATGTLRHRLGFQARIGFIVRLWSHYWKPQTADRFACVGGGKYDSLQSRVFGLQLGRPSEHRLCLGCRLCALRAKASRRALLGPRSRGVLGNEVRFLRTIGFALSLLGCAWVVGLGFKLVFVWCLFFVFFGCAWGLFGLCLGFSSLRV